jgi:hypothetical protein
MAERHIVSALVNKRTEEKLGQFRVEPGHLDADICLYAPELEPKTIPVKSVSMRRCA